VFVNVCVCMSVIYICGHTEFKKSLECHQKSLLFLILGPASTGSSWGNTFSW
jgi:uncharacterized membrane protein